MLYAIQLHRFIHNFEEKLKCFYLLMLLVFTFHKETLKVFKMVHLTQQQLKIIRDTWTHVHPIATHGQNIFYNFFKKYPQNLQYFPKFHGIELEKIKVILASKCKF